jgi:hypothetical protein
MKTWGNHQQFEKQKQAGKGVTVKKASARIGLSIQKMFFK